MKVTVELPAALHRDLTDYGRLSWLKVVHQSKPPSLVVPMLERFIATDRGFAKARRTSSGSLGLPTP